MNRTCGEAIGIAVESSPSVGLAVVDSMAARRIKAFASHAQAFREPPRVCCASARITPRRAVLADGLDHLAVPSLFPLPLNRDQRMRRRNQQQDVKKQSENRAKHDQEQ